MGQMQNIKFNFCPNYTIQATLRRFITVSYLFARYVIYYKTAYNSYADNLNTPIFQGKYRVTEIPFLDKLQGFREIKVVCV
jgi:hypothetical protein